MRKHSIAVAMLSAMSLSSHAGDYSIKGMEIGADIEAFADTYHCFPDNDGLIRCHQSPAKFTVGGQKLKSVLLKFGRDEKVELITFSFEPDAFAGIRDAVTQKYPKIKCTKGAVKTLMGVDLPSESCIGMTTAESIQLDKYGSSIDYGSLLIIKNSVVDQSIRQRQENRSDI